MNKSNILSISLDSVATKQFEKSDGPLVRLKDLVSQGSIFLFCFKSTCGLNPKTIPALKALFNVCKNPEVIYGVSNCDQEGFERFQDQYDVPFSIILDPDQEIIDALQLTRSPAVFLVDQNCKVIKEWKGLSQSLYADLYESLSEICGMSASVDLSTLPTELTFG